MSLETLTEKFYSKFQKNQIILIRDIKELTKLKTELINFNKEVVDLEEGTYSNIEKFLNWTVMSKAEMLKEIKNRLEFIDKIIIFENQEKNNNDKVEKEFFNLLFKENIQEIRNFLTQHPIHLNHLTIIEKNKDNLNKINITHNKEIMQIILDFGIKPSYFIKNIPNSFCEALLEKNFDLAEVLLNDMTNINEKIEQKGDFTPIMATFTLLSAKNLTEKEIKNYMKIIYLLCQNKDIKIDSPSYGENNALDYAIKISILLKILRNDVHNGFIQFLNKKGARKFQDQKLERDEIMKKFDEEVTCKQLENSLNNPIVNLFSQSFNWIATELINKITNDLVSVSVDVLKNVL